MIPAKPLICGIAAVGSVSTAAVVANQYGVFSKSSQKQRTNITPNAETQDNAEPTGDVSEPTADPASAPATTKSKKDEIKEWLTNPKEIENNNFEIKIKKDNEDAKTLDSTDEEELIGLLKYLKENKTKLLKYKSPKEGSKVSLTLKKEQNNWKLIYKDTINDWVINALGEKENLKLYEKDGSEKTLSGITDENELKKLFDDLNKEINLNIFKKVSESQTNPKIVVFEDYNTDWTHIKEAVHDFLTNPPKSYTLKIKINDSQEDIKNDNVKDNDLIGLLSHLEANGDNYKDKGCLVLRKNGNDWAKIDETCQ